MLLALMKCLRWLVFHSFESWCLCCCWEAKSRLWWQGGDEDGGGTISKGRACICGLCLWCLCGKSKVMSKPGSSQYLTGGPPAASSWQLAPLNDVQPGTGWGRGG